MKPNQGSCGTCHIMLARHSGETPQQSYFEHSTARQNLDPCSVSRLSSVVSGQCNIWAVPGVASFGGPAVCAGCSTFKNNCKYTHFMR